MSNPFFHLFQAAVIQSPSAASAVPPFTDRLWLASGKLHPLIVHFPIALLVVAAVFEFVRLRRGIHKPSGAAFACLWMGAIGAAAAAVLGWSSAETAGYSGSTAWILTTHRWLGVSTAIVAVFAASIATLSRVWGDLRLLRAYRAAMVFAVLLVGIAGHFGGSLVHGETYIQDAIAQAIGRETTTTGSTPGGEAGGVALASGPAGAVDFHRDIEPILMKRCYQCHTGEKPEGGLSLASRDAAIKGGKSGKPSIIPGNSAGSYLYQLVAGHDSSKRMPPKGGALADEQVAAIRSWIDGGASWTTDHRSDEHWHWAYRAPARVNPPAVKDPSWPRSPIDHFILARIDAQGLTPSPEADRATLIRRLSLDLIGLPPSVDEVDSFVQDRSPDAYEKVVDRLLASPHYGERWARVWLDLARYADSHGFEKDPLRIMWPYRDQVIRAFNADQPFDQFTIEQLAGDMLPDPTGEQLLASGFHRNTQINEEGGVDVEEFRIDAVIDRTNTTGTVWLGSTVGCAQCHDHKNDPLTQKEYFELLAIFNQDAPDVSVLNSYENFAGGAMIDYPREGRFDELAKLKSQIAEAEGVINASTPALEAEQAAWEQDARARLAAWKTLATARAVSTAGATLTMQDDGSLLAGGIAPEVDTYTIDVELPPGSISALRLETIPDPSLPQMGAGRADNSNFVITGFSISVLASDGDHRIALGEAASDFHQVNQGGVQYAIAGAIDDDPKTGWAVAGQTTLPHTAVFKLAEPIVRAEPTKARCTITQEFGAGHCVGRFRLSATSDPYAIAAESALWPAAFVQALAAPTGLRTEAQRGVIRQRFRSVTPTLAAGREQLAALQARRAELIVARAMVMQRSDTPRQTHVFERGSFLSPAAPVEPRTPSYLPPMPAGEPVNRLTYARWLVNPKNPLTARVTVNRLWEHLFGKGIVETSDDFGVQGEPPTHPELLDWLATELVRNQWSLKQTLKTVVSSAVYRQSSHVTPQLEQRDPYNKLYARAPRIRVEAEMIRDIALTSSGLLSPTIGGPSVYPPQPEGTWTQIYSGNQWMTSTGPDRYRRGLYTFWRRTSPYPTFTGFDAPSREIACTRRPRTNTPLQALATMNDPAFVEMAAALARRMLTEGGPTTVSRATYGLRLCIARVPTPEEVDRVVALYQQQHDSYQLDEASASDLAALGTAGAGGEYNAAEVSAWTVVANVLLNLDETITRQ